MLRKAGLILVSLALGAGLCFAYLQHSGAFHRQALSIDSGPSLATDYPVFSPYQQYAVSQRLLDNYLQDDVLAEVLEAAKPAVVRIKVYLKQSGGAFQTAYGSGVLMGSPPVVLTAAHVLTALQNDPSAEAVAVLADGRNVPIELLEVGSDGADWATLSPTKAGALDGLPSLMPGRRDSTDDRLLVLGYPAQAGVDKDGNVVADATKSEQALAPLGLVAAPYGNSLRVIAGMPPAGGMSGGPVINLRGQVVGNVHGWAHTGDTRGQLFTVAVTEVEQP